jgi:hypothetical protein
LKRAFENITLYYLRGKRDWFDRMPYRILRNGVNREGVKASPDLASRPFCHIPSHKIWYGI